jgi:hypothetical protein
MINIWSLKKKNDDSKKSDGKSNKVSSALLRVQKGRIKNSIN